MREHCLKLESLYVNRKVRYQGEVYTVLRVDSNGALLIDKPDQFKKDTAVWPYMVGLIIE